MPGVSVSRSPKGPQGSQSAQQKRFPSASQAWTTSSGGRASNTAATPASPSTQAPRFQPGWGSVVTVSPSAATVPVPIVTSKAGPSHEEG